MAKKKFMECDDCGKVIEERLLNEVRLKTTFWETVMAGLSQRKVGPFRIKKVCDVCAPEQ